MGVLPKNFPEHCMMHKALTKKIFELEQKNKSATREEKEGNEIVIKNYQSDIQKIERLFPENFFKELQDGD